LIAVPLLKRPSDLCSRNNEENNRIYLFFR